VAARTPTARQFLIAAIVIAVIVLIILIVRALGDDDPGGSGRSGGGGSGSGSGSVGPGSKTYVVDADMVGDRLRPGSHPDALRFFIGDDPTAGSVDYDRWDDLISYDPASRRTIMKVSGPGDVTAKGRRSLRLVSQNCYDTGLFIISADNIPEGNGTWPAFWLTAREPSANSWACHGEIDIIEGVNSVAGDANSSRNAMTLHTSDSEGRVCRQDGVPGIGHGGVCSAGSNSDNKRSGCGRDQHGPDFGCGVTSQSPTTFGYGFNRAGGGVYATELLPSGAVTIWFFPKGTAPADIADNTPEPSTWPAKYIATAFKPCPGSFAKMQVILNTTLCGGWAGGVYKPKGEDQCKLDLVTADISKAFWSIEYIKVFSRRDSPQDVTAEPMPRNNSGGGHTPCPGGGCPTGQKCVGGLCVPGGGPPPPGPSDCCVGSGGDPCDTSTMTGTCQRVGCSGVIANNTKNCCPGLVAQQVGDAYKCVPGGGPPPPAPVPSDCCVGSGGDACDTSTMTGTCQRVGCSGVAANNTKNCCPGLVAQLDGEGVFRCVPGGGPPPPGPSDCCVDSGGDPCDTSTMTGTCQRVGCSGVAANNSQNCCPGLVAQLDGEGVFRCVSNSEPFDPRGGYTADYSGY
jgi:hypothetical protein